MKHLLTFLLLLTTSVWATNELDRALQVHYQKNGIVVENKSVDDHTLVRRIYLDIAGRIPTLQEIKVFVEDRSPDKRQRLVEKILYSEDYTNNFYNFWADLLRIRPERLADDSQLKSYGYMELVRDFIRSDEPYDKFVEKLLTAQGRIMDNPYGSYMLRDANIDDTLGYTVSTFLGKDIQCAACHDSPFTDDTQLQFYQLKAFFNHDNRENRKDYGQILKRVDDQIKKITGKERVDNNVRQLLGLNLLNIKDNAGKQIKLPFDYKYENGKPNEVVMPATFDGKYTNVVDNKRQVFARWIVQNERFAPNISNRIWQNIVGIPLYENPGAWDSTRNNQLMEFLSKYLIDNNYSVKSLIRLIILSDYYSRTVQDTEGIKSIVIKRLSAEQLWDSLLVLIIPDVNYSRISFDEYYKLIKIDWDTVNGEKLLAQVEAIRAWERSLSANFLRHKNIDLVRACFIMNRNSFVEILQKEFGASDRLLLDTSNDKGSISQLLLLMNSNLNDVLADKKSQVMANYEKDGKNKNSLFMTIMGRPYRLDETTLINQTKVEDLIWVLTNTREMMFRK